MKRPLHVKRDADPDMARIAEAAAGWRARCDAMLGPREEAEFAAWLAADKRHAEVFAEMDVTWAILDRASEVPPETLRAAATERPPAVDRRSARLFWRTALAAAAAVAIGLTGWQALRMRNDAFVVATEVGPGLVKRVNLPDGSVVRLNADSAMNVRFTAGERRVVLQRGEASFDVAKNPNAAFVVTVASVEVRAVGTTFNVALRAQSVEVLVSEGKVSVDDALHGGSLLIVPEVPGAGPERSHLAAGEKVTIPAAGRTPARAVAPVTVAPETMAQALAWQERRLEFNSTPLSEIAAEFNRCNQHQLVIADDALARQRFAGSFRADDPDTFVQLIATRRGVLVDRRPGETILRRAR